MSDLVIRNAVLATIDSEITAPPRDLVIRRGHIVKDETAGPEAEVIDGSNLYAVPGLIDMHVHATSDPGVRLARLYSAYATDPGALALLAALNLHRALTAGITTVRDLGAPGDSGFLLRQAWTAGLFVGARPVVSGPVVTAVGGHASWMGLEVSTPADAVRHVRANIGRGAQTIKLAMASAQRPVELSPGDLAAAIDEAHWQGIPVAVHANFSERSIDTAVAAGCDSIEHGYAISQRTAVSMAEQGVALCPTLTTLHTIVENAHTVRRRAGDALVRRAAESMDHARESLARATDAGVTIVAGTDAGVPLVEFDSIPRELELLVSWGLTPARAMAGATTEAARLLRRSDLGNLHFGSRGDVLLLERDPREDVTAWRSLVMVAQDGKVHLLRHSERRL